VGAEGGGVAGGALFFRQRDERPPTHPPSQAGGRFNFCVGMGLEDWRAGGRVGGWVGGCAQARWHGPLALTCLLCLLRLPASLACFACLLRLSASFCLLVHPCLWFPALPALACWPIPSPRAPPGCLVVAAAGRSAWSCSRGFAYSPTRHSACLFATLRPPFPLADSTESPLSAPPPSPWRTSTASPPRSCSCTARPSRSSTQTSPALWSQTR
jgi:hypothetical protein